jgi:hypothetical protein
MGSQSLGNPRLQAIDQALLQVFQLRQVAPCRAAAGRRGPAGNDFGAPAVRTSWYMEE